MMALPRVYQTTFLLSTCALGKWRETLIPHTRSRPFVEVSAEDMALLDQGG